MLSIVTPEYAEYIVPDLTLLSKLYCLWMSKLMISRASGGYDGVSVPPTFSEQMPVSTRSVTVPQKNEHEGEEV